MQQGFGQMPQQMQPQQPYPGAFGQQQMPQRMNQGYGQQYQQTYDNNYPQQYGSYEQPQQNYEQPQNFQNPDYINPASPQMPGVTPGKTGGSSLIVPIILIILILAVICIDVFWLFRDQIWGKKDDSSTAAVSYITMTDE